MSPSRSTQTRTQRQGARSREKILDAAERLMAERGFSATSIAAIRKESGLPASSIYWHFQNKEGLLAAVMQRSAARWLSEFGNPHELPGDARERLRAYVERGFSSIGSRPPDFLRLSILLALEREEIAPASLAMILQVRKRGRELIGAALRDAFPHPDPGIADEIVAECTPFALAFMEGSFITHKIEPEGTEASRLAVQLEVALVALANDVAGRATPLAPSTPRITTLFAAEDARE
jgi:AcrR family transcriptional regulator